MKTIDRSREGTRLAPALYPAESVTIQNDGSVLITGEPIRGEVTLLSCYTPAWWYASCRACNYIESVSLDEFDPRLSRLAEAHRCSDKPGDGYLRMMGWLPEAAS